MRLRRTPPVAPGDLVLDHDTQLPCVFAIERLSARVAHGQVYLASRSPFFDRVLPLDQSLPLGRIRSGLRRGTMTRVASDGRPAIEQARDLSARSGEA